MDALYSEKGVDITKLDSMELAPLVDLGKKHGILSDETVDIAP